MNISFKMIRKDKNSVIEATDPDTSHILCCSSNSITIQTYPKYTYIAIKIINATEKYTAVLCDDEGNNKSILKKIGEYHIIDKSVSSSLYINPGRSQIKVQNKNGNTIWTGKILVVPSNFTVKQFEQMLNDILEFKLELLFSTNAKQMQNRVSLHKKRAFSCMLEDLTQIRKTLVQISRNPHQSGKIISVVTNKGNIRSIDSDIIRQYIENPWRQNYRVKRLVKQSTNYENTIIFQKLKELDDNISRMIAYYKKELNSNNERYEARKIYLQKKNNRDRDGFITANNIEATVYSIRQNDYIQSLNDIHGELCSILKLKLFSKIKNKKYKNLGLKLTQVFSNDARYKKVYGFLKKINNYQLEVSFKTQDNPVFIEKVPTLYEYWILIKIIDHLMSLGFYCENNISEILDIIWQNKKSWGNIEQKIIFVKDNITIILFYDSTLSQSLRYLKRQKMIFDSAGVNLRPDYVFIVETPRDEKVFILDAKYRKYDEMNNSKNNYNYWYYHDIQEIAKNKYIDRIKELCDIDISMSFVVHTDMMNDEPFSSIPNPNHYLGKYVTYDVENDNRFYLIDAMRKREYEENTVRDKYKYGTFYMAPDDGVESNNSSSNLEKFFSLMFEFYMGEWKSYCWKCGEKINEEDITEPPQTTRYPKYYVKCHNCGNLTVKNNCSNRECGDIAIIKHIENYFVEADGDRWLLRCPRCGRK